MTPQFVDMSQFQPEPINWPVYKAWASQWDGISRVAMRSSYGVGYADQYFAAHRANALAVGIDQIIYYHYAYPEYNNSVNEANSQLAIVGSVRPQDVLRLDLEESVPQADSAWAYNWLAQQEANYGKLPGIYASSAYITERLQDARLAKYPLWLANWQFTPDERPAVPLPWASYEFVQYSDRASIPGIPGIVDANIFLGGTIPMPTPTQPGKNQLIAANNRWNSILKNEVVGPAPTGSGIYNVWLSDYCQSKFHGPPTTHEYDSVDWSGNPIIVQEFAYGWCEWSATGGLLGWYRPNGKIS